MASRRRIIRNWWSGWYRSSSLAFSCCTYSPWTLWVSARNKSFGEASRVRYQGCCGAQDRGIPLPPPMCGIIGLARFSPQNPDVKELTGQNLDSKGLRTVRIAPCAAVTASMIIAQVPGLGKVRCHNRAVEISWRQLHVRPEILLDELFVEGGRVQQAGVWHREEGLFGAGWCR
jgi:hypothetical protein